MAYPQHAINLEHEAYTETTSGGVQVTTTPGGASLSETEPRFDATITRVAGFVAMYGGYDDVGQIREHEHPITVLQAPREVGKRKGSSFIYIATDLSNVVLKASTPGHSDARSFQTMQWLHGELADTDSRVHVPAQLALIESRSTAQTVQIMDKVPGQTLGEYLAAFPRQESRELYHSTLEIVRKQLREVVGWLGVARLDDLGAKRDAANILLDGDPHDENTQFYVIDQRSTLRGALHTKLHKLAK